MAFKLTILSLHEAGDTIFVYDDKMVKQTIFGAIPVAPYVSLL